MITPRTQRRLATLLAILALTLIPRTTHAGDPPTIHVPGDFPTLREALAAASEPFTIIELAAGDHLVSGETIEHDTIPVTIRGAGMDVTRIVGDVDPTTAAYGIRFHINEVTMEDLTVTSFATYAIRFGPAVHFNFLNRCRFTECATAIHSGRLDCRDCVFDHCNGSNTGAVKVTGDSIFVRCTFDSNHAPIEGGAISGSEFFASYCTFINNSSGQYGGALHGRPQLLGCILQNNTAEVAGGAIFVTSGSIPPPPAALSDTVTCDNTPNEIWGPWEDYGQNSIGICTCQEDLNVDGDVGFEDLVQLLSAWGPCF